MKIDRSFVRGRLTDESSGAIVRATIDLAHTLHFEVVAEGVEDEATWRKLALLGCDRLQGYAIARPLPPGEVTKWLRQNGVGLATQSRSDAGSGACFPRPESVIRPRLPRSQPLVVTAPCDTTNSRPS